VIGALGSALMLGSLFPPVPMQLAQIQDLYDRGLFLQAYDALFERCGGQLPTDLPEAVLAVRLSSQLDTPREHNLLYRHLQKHWAESAPGRRFRIYRMSRYGKLVEALQLSLAEERPADADDEEYADWLQARAQIYSGLRDFERAEECLAASLPFTEDLHWVELLRCYYHWRNDEPERALARAEELIEEYPDYAALYSLAGDLHFDLDHREEALHWYAQGGERFELPSLWYHHARILRQIGRLEEARSKYRELLERREWPKRSLGAAARDELFRIAHELGEHEEAARLWGEASSYMRKFYEVYEPVAEGQQREARRVHHKVPYVRQDELTCAPATLSAVLRWFGVDVPHDEAAGQITYTGTPDYRLHAFCKERGLEVRPFQFEEDAAKRLLDLGLPFCLGTRAPESGHLQALVGYDEDLGVWLVREPGVHHWIEIPMKGLREEAAARGAPCTLVAPPERLAALEGEGLPFERQVDLMNQVFSGLEGHRLEDALTAVEELEAGPAGPWLWDAERSTGAYTGDIEREHAASRAQLEAFPKDDYVRVTLALTLLRSGRGEELPELAAEWGNDFDRSPHIDLHVVDELSRHRDQLERALWLGRRVCWRMPGNAEAKVDFAHLLWTGQGDREAALHFYRAATTLDKFDERAAWAYFDACMAMGQIDVGLAWLEFRAETLGQKHASPRLTLARAYAALYREKEQLEELGRALEAPLGRDRAVHERVDLHVERDELDEGLALIEAHEGELRRAVYLARKAELLRLKGEVAEAVALIRPAVEEAPTDGQLQGEHAACLDALEGAGAVAEFMRPYQEQHPTHLGLSRILGQALMGLEDPAGLESFLSERVQSHPRDSLSVDRWMALLARSGRGQELVDFGRDFEPRYGHRAWFWFQLARGHVQLEQFDEAKAALRRTMELDPLHEAAPNLMLQLARSPEEAQETLRSVAAGFAKERVDGSSLSNFVRLASDVLADEEVEGLLERLAERFPEMPEIAETRADFFARQDREEDALAAARSALERWPHRRDTILLLARIEDALGDADEALRIAQDFFDKNPRDAGAAVQLGGMLEERGSYEKARVVYADTLLHRPLAPVLHAYLGDVLLRLGKLEEGLQSLRRAIELDPFYSWSRATEINVLAHLRRYDEAKERADAMVAFLKDDEMAWQAKANLHDRLGEEEEAIAAMREALRCDPLLGDARRRLVFQLADAKRYEEARETIAEGIAALGPTPELRRLDAWVVRRTGEHAEARTALEQLLEEHPSDDASWHMYLTWIGDEGDDARLDELMKDTPPALADLARFHEVATFSLLARQRWKEAARRAEAWIKVDPAEERALDVAAQMWRAAKDKKRADMIWIGHPEPETASGHAAVEGYCAAERRFREEKLRFFERILKVDYIDRDDIATLQKTLRKVSPEIWEIDRDHYRDDEEAQDGMALCELLRGNKEPMRKLLEEVSPDDDDGDRLARLLNHCRGAKEFKLLEGHLLPRFRDAGIPAAKVWGTLGYIFCTWKGKRGARIVIDAMSKDYQREDAEPWMLVNLAYAYQVFGDAKRCEEVNRHALAQPRDHGFYHHRPLLAWARMAQGDWSEVESLIEDRDSDQEGPYLQCLAYEALLELRAAHGSERDELFKQHFARLMRKADELGQEEVGGTGLSKASFRFFAKQLIKLGLPITGLCFLAGGPLRWLAIRWNR
jgi:tetratricopeptide (TPR) repeat protein